MGMGWGLLPFGGYYGGFGYPPAVAVGGGGGGGGLFTLIIFGIVAFALMSSLANNRADADEEDGVPTGRVTVAKLQIGLLGSARSLQRDLDRIAGKADTSTPSGLHFVLQGTRVERERESQERDTAARPKRRLLLGRPGLLLFFSFPHTPCRLLSRWLFSFYSQCGRAQSEDGPALVFARPAPRPSAARGSVPAPQKEKKEKPRSHALLFPLPLTPETVLALLRNPEYAVYGACGTRRLKSLSSGEAAFNEASMDERGKLAEETLVNVGGRARAGPYSKGGGAGGAGGDDDELVVVTLLVAARGGLALPKVTSAGELRAALNRLGSVPSEDVLAVEVLWTPQDPRDKYYRSDAVADYPTLNVL